MGAICSFLNSLVLKEIIILNTRIISANIIAEFKKIENTGLILQNDNLSKISSTYIKGIFLNITTKNIIDLKNNAENIYRSHNVRDVYYVLKDFSKKLSFIILSDFRVPLNFSLKKIKGENLYICGIGNNKFKINNFCLRTSLYNRFLSIFLIIIYYVAIEYRKLYCV